MLCLLFYILTLYNTDRYKKGVRAVLLTYNQKMETVNHTGARKQEEIFIFNVFFSKSPQKGQFIASLNILLCNLLYAYWHVRGNIHLLF